MVVLNYMKPIIIIILKPAYKYLYRITYGNSKIDE